MKARRAWGLTADTPRPQQQSPSQTRPRHRFVQDGEVPVEIRNIAGTPRATQAGSRITALETEIAAEHVARVTAERALDEARTLIHSLQSRLADAELVAEQTIAIERRARAEAQAALQQAQRKSPTPPEASAAAKAPATRPGVVRTRTAAPARTSEPKTPNDQPVEWWVPGYRNK